MSVQAKGNELITGLLHDWYYDIRAQHVHKAQELKEVVDKAFKGVKDKSLLFYYSLLNFRYQVLTDVFNVKKESFDTIEALEKPTDNFLLYSYHFCKAMHCTIMTNYQEAKEHYERAENLLAFVSEELEHAEFNYRVASFYYHIYEPLLAIEYGKEAKELFLKHRNHEINVALCKNVLGLSCVYLKQFEKAEEYLTSAIDMTQKQGEEHLTLRFRHNLGLMYAGQNAPRLAIRYLSEVNRNIPNHYKALLIEAKEHLKLGETEIASELIEKGLNICVELQNEEYQHRFKIVREMNNGVPAEQLEKVIVEGIVYFEREELWEYVHEYTEELAMEFHQEENYPKASKYFHISVKAKQKLMKKGALK
ncbi:tetratricopeptide repeat protein [Bacillus sp. KbaB1]|uniref:response regulator aspartate phosphatase n=1 Tax=Bacillus sp. KbaB1 TaxID=1972845 RepID=UPI000B7F0030|nr:tetratricopeptide repeat protein [Bacillus sp. KbaB1]OXL97091.1 hypothetical protein B6N65_17550 [Bacillus sp. KbaB1]